MNLKVSMILMCAFLFSTAVSPGNYQIDTINRVDEVRIAGEYFNFITHDRNRNTGIGYTRDATLQGISLKELGAHSNMPETCFFLKLYYNINPKT